MTYLTKVQYLHAGGTVTYPFNFVGGYLDPAHIKVDVEVAGNVTTSTATLASAGSVSVTAVAGAIVTVRRETPKVTLTKFLEDTNYDEKALDTAARQALLFCGEVYDQLQDIVAPSGFAELVGGNSFQGNQSVGTVTLTDAAQIDIDAALSNNFQVTLEGNRLLNNPDNRRDGMVINIFIKQGVGGGKSLTYSGKYKWPGGVPPALSTDAGAVDLLVAQYNYDLDIWACSLLKDFR